MSLVFCKVSGFSINLADGQNDYVKKFQHNSQHLFTAQRMTKKNDKNSTSMCSTEHVCYSKIWQNGREVRIFFSLIVYSGIFIKHILLIQCWMSHNLKFLSVLNTYHFLAWWLWFACGDQYPIIKAYSTFHPLKCGGT